MVDDVPITVDFRVEGHARAWTESAMAIRPWRTEFFDAFANEIENSDCGTSCRVLELGSGPGFLAERLLGISGVLKYVAVDFSSVMHQLAKERLGKHSARVQFVERNLRDANWSDGLGEFHFIVTHQAVHELRHKRHAPTLHAQVRRLLVPGGAYLVCDHYCGEGGMSNDQLYMSVEEQRHALMHAGFNEVEQVLPKGGLVLHRATYSAGEGRRLRD